MDSQNTVREWARELGLPVLVVCRASLGTLNHTLLTMDSIRDTGLGLPGLIMNFHGVPEDDAARTNPGILEDWSKKPVAKLPSQAETWEIPGWLRSVLA
jgi:dethiobiotin synthetase